MEDGFLDVVPHQWTSSLRTHKSILDQV